MKRKRQIDDDPGINITPMLDVVFIMLIFFMVTTSFVKETGLDIGPSSSAPSGEMKPDTGPIVVRIDRYGVISVKGRVVEARALRANLEREKAEKPLSPMIVAADPDADTEALVTVLDAARTVGIETVNVATGEP
jgi:biopolymer transport protein ExbD